MLTLRCSKKLLLLLLLDNFLQFLFI